LGFDSGTKILWKYHFLTALEQINAVGGSPAQQAAALATPLDILVGTPQKIVQQAEKGLLFFGDVQYVILDEADTMFDKGFGPEVRALLTPVRKKEQPAVCILVLATLKKARIWHSPQSMEKHL